MPGGRPAFNEMPRDACEFPTFCQAFTNGLVRKMGHGGRDSGGVEQCRANDKNTLSVDTSPRSSAFERCCAPFRRRPGWQVLTRPTPSGRATSEH